MKGKTFLGCVLLLVCLASGTVLGEEPVPASPRIAASMAGWVRQCVECPPRFSGPDAYPSRTHSLQLDPAGRPHVVHGEGFLYLGRSYRLKMVALDDGQAPLRLHQGWFLLDRDQQARAREHFIRWYIEHAEPWLGRRVELFKDRVGVRPRDVHVRDLGARWGSCNRQGDLNFHWRSILLPPRVVEYLVVHELVHLHEPHHTPDFWRRLERAMPDFPARKRWLAENGVTADV